MRSTLLNGRFRPAGTLQWSGRWLAWLAVPVFWVLLTGLPGCGRRGDQQLVPLSNMVPIKAGKYLRISHPVTLTRGFWMAKCEVTQGEFMAVMGRNPSHFTGSTNLPAEKLSWFDAQAYCRELTRQERAAGRLPATYEYRLPTEAEWEYACRAGTTNLYSFGDSPSEAEKYAWTMENSSSQTHPVGQKLPNPWGLYDMHGNVWEWCSDWFAPYPPTELVDPVGPESSKFKVFRGGGWNQAVEFARSRNRFMMSPTNGIYFVGFRVALGQILQPPLAGRTIQTNRAR